MSSLVIWTLVALIVLLLAALLFFEKRRQRQRQRLAFDLERLELEERFDEIDELLCDEEAVDREPWHQALAAFLKGRATRRVTAVSLVSFLHGLVGIGLLGWVLYMVLKSAVNDPVVRLVLLATTGVCAMIVGIAAAAKRSKREKELLLPRGANLPPHS